MSSLPPVKILPFEPERGRAARWARKQAEIHPLGLLVLFSVVFFFAGLMVGMALASALTKAVTQ